MKSKICGKALLVMPLLSALFIITLFHDVAYGKNAQDSAFFSFSTNSMITADSSEELDNSENSGDSDGSLYDIDFENNDNTVTVTYPEYVTKLHQSGTESGIIATSSKDHKTVDIVISVIVVIAVVTLLLLLSFMAKKHKAKR